MPKIKAPRFTTSFLIPYRFLVFIDGNVLSWSIIYVGGDG